MGILRSAEFTLTTARKLFFEAVEHVIPFYGAIKSLRNISCATIYILDKPNVYIYSRSETFLTDS